MPPIQATCAIQAIHSPYSFVLCMQEQGEDGTGILLTRGSGGLWSSLPTWPNPTGQLALTAVNRLYCVLCLSSIPRCRPLVESWMFAMHAPSAGDL